MVLPNSWRYSNLFQAQICRLEVPCNWSSMTFRNECKVFFNRKRRMKRILEHDHLISFKVQWIYSTLYIEDANPGLAMFSLVFYSWCCVLVVCLRGDVRVRIHVILVIACKQKISSPLHISHQADVASSFLQQIYYCFALLLVTIAALSTQ